MKQNDELRPQRELRLAVDRLPREVRPERDLWPEIAARLDERPREGFAAGWWRLAAAVVLVAGGLLAAVVLQPEARPAGSSIAGVAQESAPVMAAAHLRQRDGVLHAHNDLVAVVSRRRGRLDDAGAAAITAGLADLEQAAADIEAALAINPNDRRLRLALAAAYRRESDWTMRLSRV
jgi:hypothetical protein